MNSSRCEILLMVMNTECFNKTDRWDILLLKYSCDAELIVLTTSPSRSGLPLSQISTYFTISESSSCEWGMFYSESIYWSSKLKWLWDKISRETSRSAINDVHKRLQIVLKATWNHTKWDFLLLYNRLTFILCRNFMLT